MTFRQLMISLGRDEAEDEIGPVALATVLIKMKVGTEEQVWLRVVFGSCTFTPPWDVSFGRGLNDAERRVHPQQRDTCLVASRMVKLFSVPLRTPRQGPPPYRPKPFGWPVADCQPATVATELL